MHSHWLLLAIVALQQIANARLDINDPVIDPTKPYVPAPTSGIVAAFFENQNPQDPSTMPFNLLTHVIFAFANVQNDCSIFTQYQSDLDPTNKFSYASVSKAARTANANIKIMLSFGGDWQNLQSTSVCGAFTACVSSAANRATLINNMFNWARTNSFDGIDLDWESPGIIIKCGVPADKANLVSLVQEMQVQNNADVAAGKSRLIVSMSPIASPSYIQSGLDLAQLHYSVDFFNLQFYEMTLGDIGVTEPHTALQYNKVGSSMVDSLTRCNDLPANKIVAGVGFFSKAYTIAPGSTCAYYLPDQGFNLGAIMRYSQIVAFLAANPNVVANEDVNSTTSFFCATAANGDYVLQTYSSASDLQKDINFFLTQNLAGTNIWTVNDDAPGFPLTNMLAKNMIKPITNPGGTPSPAGGASGAPPATGGSSNKINTGFTIVVAIFTCMLFFGIATIDVFNMS